MRRRIFHFPFSIFNLKDGVFTPDVDVRREWTFSRPGGISLTIGDMDNDNIPDGVERAEGTDPNARTNYCCSVSVTYTGIFQTTNALTFAALWGTNTVWGPTPVTTKTWTHDFGHRVTTQGERASVQVWDDIDGNGKWDENETGDTYTFWPYGHAMAVTNELAYGHFDWDDDDLPDWWEMAHELSMYDPMDAWEDSDGDGLVNIQEYLYEGDPQSSIGTNNLFWSCAHSIDERLLGMDPRVSLTVFDNYMSNASNLTFVANENFWAADIDFSCICVWNSHVGQQKERAGALISPRHLLVANHWYPQSTNEILYFRGRSGTIYQRRAVSWRGFSVPQSVSTRPDTGVVLLDSPLDTNDVAVCALASISLLDKVGDGYGVPFIYLNQRKEAVVKEIRSLTGYQIQEFDFSAFQTIPLHE